MGYPPPSQRPATRGRGWAGALLLCAVVGLVVACGAGIVGVLAASGRAIHRATTASRAALDAPARDGKFEFAVTGITCGKVAEGDGDVLVKAARGQFCEVTLAVRNIGDRSQVFAGAWQRAKCSDGSTIGDDTAAELYANPGDRVFVRQIDPGAQVQGLVVFDIPWNVRIVSLQLHDSLLSAGVIVPVG